MPKTTPTNFPLTGIQGVIGQGAGNNYSSHRKLLYIIGLPTVISLQSGNKFNFAPKIKHKHFYGIYFKTLWVISDYTVDGKMKVKNELEGVWKDEVLV
jgi:hypothetical protein